MRVLLTVTCDVTVSPLSRAQTAAKESVEKALQTAENLSLECVSIVRVDVDETWPWCDACKSYHHPSSPYCFLKDGFTCPYCSCRNTAELDAEQNECHDCGKTFPKTVIPKDSPAIFADAKALAEKSDFFRIINVEPDYIQFTGWLNSSKIDGAKEVHVTLTINNDGDESAEMLFEEEIFMGGANKKNGKERKVIMTWSEALDVLRSW